MNPKLRDELMQFLDSVFYRYPWLEFEEHEDGTISIWEKDHG